MKLEPIAETSSFVARVILALLVAGCTSAAPRYPVDTELGLTSLRTTVDSDVAARYLNDTGGARIAALRTRYDALKLGNDELLALATETSTDFAAAYFARRVLQAPRHRDAQERFNAALARLRAGHPLPIEELDRARFVFLFVPGLFYERRPENGAAMAATRSALRERGFTTILVPTGELSTVEEGARVLVEYLREARASSQEVILTSASKGGADVAHALGNLMAGEDLSHVRGWVSIGGVLRGTPLADVGLTFPSSWLLALTGWAHGTSIRIARDLSTAEGARRAATYAFPAHLQVIHFVGVPLSGTVSDSVRGNYNTMLRYGPNDGVTLLPDQVIPQGHIVLAPGADHRFQNSGMERKTLALANLIVELIDAKGR